MIVNENLDTVRELEMGLLETDSICKDLLPKTNKHLRRLAQMMEDSKRTEKLIFRLVHKYPEDEIVSFRYTFRTLRKDGFAIIEHVLKTRL